MVVAGYAYLLLGFTPLPVSVAHISVLFCISFSEEHEVSGI